MERGFAAQELTVGQVNQEDKREREVLQTSLEDCQELIASALDSSNKKILWLGNSQLPTINQVSEGQRTMVSLLHEQLRDRGRHLIAIAPPNANLQEHLVIASYMVARMEVETSSFCLL